MAPCQILKSSLVLLVLYYKQTVTLIAPLPNACCSTECDSHTKQHTHTGVLCAVRTKNLKFAT
jgi:hypothetical protein